jgi:hypothetical protein
MKLTTNKSLPFCKWCGHQRPLVKAHVIPKKFYEATKTGDKKVLAVTASNKGTKTETWQSGIYENTITCADCDNRLGVLDRYAYRHFLTQPDELSVIRDEKYNIALAYPYDTLDLVVFKRFLMSLLWRAHHSTHGLFASVNIGSHYETKIKETVISSQAIAPDDWSVVAIRYFDDPHPNMIYPPRKTKLDGINAYYLSIPFFTFILKIDKRPFQGIMREVQMSNENRKAVLRMPYSGCPQSKILKKFRSALQKANKAN